MEPVTVVDVNTYFQNGHECFSNTSNKGEGRRTLLYRVEDKPGFIFSSLNVLQILVCHVVSLVWVPLALSSALCLLPADPIRVYFVSTAFLTSGMVTFLQSAFGIRLPTIAAPSIILVGSLFSLLRNENLRCPSKGDLYAMGSTQREQEWQLRLSEVKGVLLFAGALQTILAISGIQAFLTRGVGYVVMAPTVILIGLTLSQDPVVGLKNHWTSSSTVVVILFILVVFGLQGVRFPLPTFSICKGLSIKFFSIFRMFPVLWVCFVVFIFYKTTSVISSQKHVIDKEVVSFGEAVDNANSFFVPVPFNWGLPSLRLSSVIQMLPAVVLQSLVSMALFHCSAKVCEVTSPPQWAVSRGLTIEGLGLLIGSFWGHGVTTSTANIALTNFTGVTSQNSTMLAALLLICLSVFTTLPAILTNLPLELLSPISLCLQGGMVCAGISMIKAKHLSSQRECSIIGFTILLGLVVPQWAASVNLTSETGYSVLDSFANTGLRSPVFVGVVVGCILNLIIPGKITDHNLDVGKNINDDGVYKLPTWEESLCNVLDKTRIFAIE